MRISGEDTPNYANICPILTTDEHISGEDTPRLCEYICTPDKLCIESKRRRYDQVMRVSLDDVQRNRMLCKESVYSGDDSLR